MDRTERSYYGLLLLFNKHSGYSSKSKHSIFYPDVPSAKKPTSHDFIPIPKPPKEWTVDETEPSSASPDDEPGPSYSNTDQNFPDPNIPHFISQSELNDLVRDLNLSKVQA